MLFMKKKMQYFFLHYFAFLLQFAFIAIFSYSRPQYSWNATPPKSISSPTFMFVLLHPCVRA